MHFLIGVVVAAACGLAAWLTSRLTTRSIAILAVPFLVVVVAGVAFGLPLYPASDLFVGAVSILGGVALGRAMPPRFRTFLILLAIFSVLDVAQNIAFSGPSPSGPTTNSTPDPHLIWLNVRLSLPTGHFNIGFADLVLIAAATENLRRRGAGMALSLLPGVIGISLGEALLATLPPNPPAVIDGIAASLVLFLTAGYVLTELAVSQTATKTA